MAPSHLPHAVPHAPSHGRYSARVAPLPTQSTLPSSGPMQRETARRGGHPAVAAGTPGGPPALGIACLVQNQGTFLAMCPCPLSLRERVRVRVPKGLRTYSRTLTPRPLPRGEGAKGSSACPKRSFETALERPASPLRHALPGLPAFFWQPYAVYIRPSGLANSHTVFCTPQRPREDGR